MGTGLVLYTILGTATDKTHVWKNSNLALDYHGLEDVNDSTRSQTMNMKSMEKAGKETFARLGGTRLKLA